MQSSFERLT